MKISIEIREPNAGGKRALRLTYYAGSYLDPTTGIRKHKRSTLVLLYWLAPISTRTASIITNYLHLHCYLTTPLAGFCGGSES